MKTWPQDLVAVALKSPADTQPWPPDTWSRLVRQARSAGLLGRLAVQARDGAAGLAHPTDVAAHFEASLRVCRAQQAEIQREMGFVQQALKGLPAPVVLLKGAAYVMAGLPASAGRLFGDIDLMVPKPQIPQAEHMLHMHGWMTARLSAYDERYYRRWMHELPPLHHVQRGTVLDVHHAILPETARLRPSAAKLFERAVPLPHHPGLHVLAPEDMVLHSMTHLFLNDDVNHALRDLSDLDLLLRHFGGKEAFWAALVPRATELDLTRPLYYGLRHTTQLLGTPVPRPVLDASAAFAPGPLAGAAMQGIWTRVLRPPDPSAAPPGLAAATLALLVRCHWLRMPPLMLARHLLVKLLRLHESRTDRALPGAAPAP